MSLYGIETEADCRKEIDELLAMVDCAEEALKIGSTTAKRTMEVLKSRGVVMYRAASPNSRSFSLDILRRRSCNSSTLRPIICTPDGIKTDSAEFHSRNEQRLRPTPGCAAPRQTKSSGD